MTNQQSQAPPASCGEYTRELPMLLRRGWHCINRAFRRRITGIGLTPDQYIILRCLSEGDPRGLTQRELAELMASDPNTVTSLLNRMQSAALIERAPHESDKRAYRIRIQAEGERRFELAHPIALELQQEVLAALPERERRDLLSLLEKIAAASCKALEEQ